MELRFFYADEPVRGNNISADHGLPHNREQPFREFVIAGNLYAVRAEQIELVGERLAVAHNVFSRRCAAVGHRRQFIVDTETHRETAVFDGTDRGRHRVELDLIHGLFLIRAANIAERHKVLFVQQQDTAALKVIVSAIPQRDIAKGFLVDCLNRKIRPRLNRRRLENARGCLQPGRRPQSSGLPLCAEREELRRKRAPGS